jgi:A/G-specific adenine glycosylase
LRTLPGIGDYTAAAIAAIAFGEWTVAVDTNVRRVAARLFGLEDPSLETVRDRLLPLVPLENPGDFTQAMMDLGATVCRPAEPFCAACPLAEDCIAFRSGEPSRYPVAKAKAARPQRFGIALWNERDGGVWLVRRPAKGLLGGMAALPGPDWDTAPSAIAHPPLARVRHVFTHFALDLAIVRGDRPEGDGWWQPLETIGGAGLPTLYRKAVEAVLAARTINAAA